MSETPSAEPCTVCSFVSAYRNVHFRKHSTSSKVRPEKVSFGKCFSFPFKLTCLNSVIRVYVTLGCWHFILETSKKINSILQDRYRKADKFHSLAYKSITLELCKT